MKKIYIKPNVKFMGMDSVDVMAASVDVIFDNEGNGTITTSDEDATVVLSKKNIWDED